MIFILHITPRSGNFKTNISIDIEGKFIMQNSEIGDARFFRWLT